MPVIAIVNPKGGSGKSTLATNLAGHAANLGLGVMLGDVDRQKSTLVWLRRREAEALANKAPVTSWVVDPQRMLRPPQGVTHVVLDTPAGLHGLELAHVLMSASAILMPVCESAFDREAAAQCWAEMSSHPRVASGRCRVGVVAMRVDGSTQAEATMRAWAEKIGVTFLGRLRYAQTYVRCIERGLTIFDLPAERTRADREQWAPILDWLDPVWTRRDLGVPSQAGSLDQIMNSGPRIATTVQRRFAEPRPVMAELAAALLPPAAVPPKSGVVQRLFASSWPWTRGAAAR